MSIETMQDDRTKTLLRFAAGVSAVIALGLAALRLYGLMVIEDVEGDVIVNGMRVLFPLTLGLLFAYLAIRGRFPGN